MACTAVRREEAGDPLPMSSQTDSTLTRVDPTFASIVCGVDGRRLSGVAAIRSTSERIAHAAPCSVLVVRR